MPTQATPPRRTPTPTAFVVEPGEFPDQPADVPWPTEEWTEADLPASVDRAAIDSVTDRAFNDALTSRVRAVVVVHRGAIVYERYSPNAADGPDEIMPSFSIAKSITSAFIGMLVRDGLLDIHDPAPVSEWHTDPSDARAEITVEHMLHMTTGMHWDDRLFAGSDIVQLVASADAGAYAAAQKPTSEPGDHFEYNTGTSTLLARLFGDAIGDNPTEIREFMNSELFHKIGMTQADGDVDEVSTDFDHAGTWMGGYSADTTARSFAKFGLLYARGGQWDGEQILPREWIEYSRTPSPANPEYGAHWWLDLQRPQISYAIGARGQVITVDTLHDLVIVQLSTVGGELPLMQTEAILREFAE